ncbi:MAG: hypothetical protein Q9218_002323 [Villophora microphyllina]
MSKKRRRELSSIDTQLVEIYEDLTNENENTRLKAAQALLTKCSPDNGQFSNDQLSEVVRRLIRGLCSGRKAARLGFSIALTELLSQRWGETQFFEPEKLSIPDLIDVLVQQTETTGNVSGQEERDHQLGRLFCIEAFIKSGVLLLRNTPGDIWPRVLDLIYDAAQKKAWLREECGWILYGAIQTLHQRKLDPQTVQVIVDKLFGNGLGKTSEGVAIWLVIQRNFPTVQLPSNVWRHNNPLDRKEKSKLAKLLKDASSDHRSDGASGYLAQKGNWTSRLHFVWNVILSELTKERSTGDTVTFGDFWQEAVDENLFAAASSDERKYWGFLLFQQLFGTAPSVHLHALFSRNFTRCLTNQLASKERYLHRAAERSIKVMIDRANIEPAAAYAALQGLIANPLRGNLFFDQSTRTKTTERLIALASDHDLETLVGELSDRFAHTVSDEKDAIARRQVIADQLAFCLKSRLPAGTSSEKLQSQLYSLISRILEFFTQHSYFVIDDQNPMSDLVPPVAEKTRDGLRTRLASCLSCMMGKWPNPAFFAYEVVESIRKKEMVEDLHSTLDISGPIGKTMADTWKLLDCVHRDSTDGSSNEASLNAFELLCSLTILQVYNGDADAVSMLCELQDCKDSVIKSRDASNEQGAEILIEVILSLVAKPSQLFRRLAQQVFEVFAQDLNGNSLSSMIKVLETKENLSGQDEMFEEDNEDQSSSDAMSSTASDVEEVEMTEANGVDHSSGDDAASQAASTRTEEADSEEDNEELAAFEMKLAQALKTKPIDPATGTADEESSSDEDMDDEQMEALDAHIATIFKERKKVIPKKTQKKDAKETIVNFKCRVLELLEIFIKKRHADLLALDLLLPLLTCIRTTTSSLISSKACGVMREYSKLCKGKAVPVFHNKNEKKASVRLLKAIHAEAMYEASNAHSSACSQASLKLVKILVAAGKDNLEKVVKIYARTQERMLLDPACRIKIGFFTDWNNWCSTARPPPVR